MAMRMPGVGGEDEELAPMAEINVTPLVDVMLVLLIIFMVTAPLMMSQLPIQLPKASLHQMGKPRDPLIVSMDDAGHYFINDEQVSLEALPGQLHDVAEQQPNNIVYVRADKSVSYGKVVTLLQLVGNAGFYKVSLMSQAPQ